MSPVPGGEEKIKFQEEHNDMAFTEADKQKMDNLAADFQNALVDREIDDDALRELANCWRDHIGAGHKRLGRILLEFADKKKD